MWTFLRVIYTKILYRIPLKFLLILLAVVAVFIASFSHALTLDNWNYPWQFEYQQVYDFYGTRDIKQYYNYTQDWISCIFVSNSYRCTLNDWTNTYNLNQWVAYCTDSNTLILNCSSSVEIYYYLFLWNNFLKQWYPDMTSLQCQTNYSLIPISSVDQNYCTTNNLCPTCPDCPSGSSWVSSLYINDILHVWSPLIYLNIPQEIGWDYEYTQWGTNMVIDVEGYNVDYDKIQWIIDVQNYKPDSDDLSDVFSMFGSYWWLLVVTLFVILFFYLIKKWFK